MEIKVKLFGAFRIDRFKEEIQDYRQGRKVQEVIDKLQLPDHLLGIVIIGDVHASAEDVLKDDVLSLLPLLDGG